MSLDKQEVIDALAAMSETDYDEVIRESRSENQKDPKQVAARMLRQYARGSSR
jgi:hypothetical protein